MINKTVVLLEDHKDLREEFHTELETAGHTVKSYICPKAFMDDLRDNSFEYSVIVSDNYMPEFPGGDIEKDVGIDFLETIRMGWHERHGVPSEIPFILWTSEPKKVAGFIEKLKPEDKPIMVAQKYNTVGIIQCINEHAA